MNDDLQKALAEILNKTTQGVEAGVGFLQRELPDVIQQLLIWHGVRSGVIFGVLVLGLIISIWLLVKGVMWSNDNDWDAGPLGVLPLIPAGMCLAGALANLEWLQILLAPKIFLIEYAASLVK